VEFVGLVDRKDRNVNADSVYVGGCVNEVLRLFPSVMGHICAMAYCNKPLSDEEKVGIGLLQGFVLELNLFWLYDTVYVWF
jgi:hypothetical protein